jgi:antirestriction protein
MEQQSQEPENENHQDEPARAEKEHRSSGSSVYVASLADYNAGRLHGQWLQANVGQEELEAGVQLMLAASPTPGAEEFAVFDYEGFGPLRLEEHESLGTLAAIARGIAQHGPAFAHWVAIVGISNVAERDNFDDVYQGHWESVNAYAEDYLDLLGANRYIEEEVPEYLQPYVRLDVEGFALDLELGGDIIASEGDGGVYVFNGVS